MSDAIYFFEIRIITVEFIFAFRTKTIKDFDYDNSFKAFGFLFMDLDHFKDVNDRWGHVVGDEVLKFVGRTLVANARPYDAYGRWGGEEFAGVIRCIGAADLERLGNRLRCLVETAFVVHAGTRIGVTLSIGATLFRPDDTVESLVKRADELLYRSKREGRNRLTLG